jgi:GMP synthase (glutamine-hydrolysing)
MVDTETFLQEATTEIESELGDANAIIALSGGVDSSVAAALAYRAVGDQLTPVYVDTGLMRKGETEQIRETFAYMDSLRVIDARDRFLDALSGVTDPEEKRHVIGEQFIREFEREARDTAADYLVQGTIYPDRIESEGNIKSHHNVGTSTKTKSERLPARWISTRSSPSGCRSPVRGSPSGCSVR